ncbi:hypothetical protein Pmani_005292 [Petrolisthes manimaculis]|uniref:Ubiquitin-like domain-containing protein n=1 Tax=Petrolisthes manimaculis TaxID=1843537 RepID=A0AAE1QE35_9EUCA|nr:hypothetical protein Pmani_005292 [Petrolisthes manimaculis]
MCDDSDLEILESPGKCNSTSINSTSHIDDDYPINTTLSDDSFDMFDFDYNAHVKQAMKYASKELLEMDEAEEDIQIVDNVTIKSNDGDCSLLTSPDVSISADMENQQNQPLSRLRKKNPKKNPTSGNNPATQKKTKKTNKSTKEMTMKKELEELSNQISKDNALCDQLNQSDVVLLSDEEEDVNREINLRIRWGTEIVRISIRKLQPFSEVYRQLGEKHGVSPSHIMLSHNHRLIPHTVCPHDLAITIVDFIEGGIMEEDVHECSSNSKNTMSSQSHITQAPDSIALKVQNSNSKATLTIHISKSDKMKILMHRYAELKDAKLEDLKFFFDGERLNPNDTPSSLDLDGGECIDVYQ